MAIIKCKMCGGDIELAADKTFGTCECCGSTMTFPKVDDDQRAAAFNRGNHFRRIGEFDKALAVYERIVREDDTDAEAHWCCALCRFGIEYVEDPATYEWLPTCHRASFDSFLEDVDFQAALTHSDGITRRQYQKDAAKIAEVQRGILATSQNTEPYDVFICYKESDAQGNRTRDSLLAQDIYYQLTEQGRKVFFARITLEDVAGTQYEPYIFAALNSAKVMVVVGTKPEHLSAVWVKNEWSRFLAMMKKDHSKLLLPCYRDMDPYDLPEQLSVLQSYDMAKIGFIQDLTRGIGKVLSAEEKLQTRETVVVQQTGGTNVSALLKRGNMALEDGEWEKADSFFEEVLNQDAECAEAYIGKALAAKKAVDLDTMIQRYLQAMPELTYKKKTIPEDQAHVDTVVERFEIHGYLNKAAILSLYYFDLSYKTAVESALERKTQLEKYWNAQKQLLRAEQFATGDVKKQLDMAKQQLTKAAEDTITQARQEETENIKALREAYVAHIHAADASLQKIHAEAAQIRNAHYENYLNLLQSDSNDIRELAKARDFFTTHADFRDSKALAEQCKKRFEDIKAQEEAERLRQRLEKAKRENSERRRRVIIRISAALLVLIIIGLAMLWTNVIQPANQYSRAEKLLENGDYNQAIRLFQSLGDYKDSAARADEAMKALEDELQRNYYTQAEKYLESGELAQAAMFFGRAGDYRDAQERSQKLWNEITPCKTIVAGANITVAIRADGTVAATGSNAYGECNVARWNNIVDICAGFSHTVGLKSDGTVLATGNNRNGQCDVLEWTDIVSIAAGDHFTVGLRIDGTVVTAGSNSDGQCNVSAWTDIIAISAGGHHTVGLKSDGTVVAVGSNSFYQCDVSDWTDIVAISAGAYHTVGLKADGTVVAAGSNSEGQCNISTWEDIVAISAGDSHTVGLRSNGVVLLVGSNSHDQSAVFPWPNIVAISAGANHTVGLRSDGTVVAIGDSASGQCSVTTWTNIKLPE